VDDAVRIRAARASDGERLREIAEAAKGYWGYDREVVREWAAGGDFSAAGLRAKEIFVAEASGRAVAWAALVPRGETVWLDDMWVEPEWIGKRVGSLLFRHAVERARELGATSMEWEAEPNAVGFYERVGGRRLRDSEPNEWGRVLPVMGIEVPS
jgi:GNAT superfamily N-acetyltransferase